MKRSLLAVLVASAALLSACTHTQLQTSPPDTSPVPMTNDVIIDANNDGQPEAALTEGELTFRSEGSDLMQDEEGTKVYALNAQNDSGQSGTATITEVNGRAKVVLTLVGGEFPNAQPAHIHVGACPNPGKVQYNLTNVLNGKSETMLTVSLEQMLASADQLAINVHKSAAESQLSTACGTLK